MMSYLGHLDTTVIIERATATITNGEVILTWATSSTVQCHRIPARPASVLRDFGYQLDADYEVFFPAGTDLHPAESTGVRDRLNIGSVYFMVLGVRDMSGKGKGLVAYVRRMA